MSAFSSTGTIGIVVIHPTPIIRLGIAKALENAYSPERIAACPDLAAWAAIAPAAAISVVLIDANEWALHAPMPASPAVRMAVITAVGALPCNKLLRSRGGLGSIPVSAQPDEFIAAVAALAAGEAYFPTRGRPAEPGVASLSQRQLEILELMSRGLLNKQIAWKLGLTEGTVKSHVSAILEKLNCHRRTQAIAAFMNGIGLGGRFATA